MKMVGGGIWVRIIEELVELVFAITYPWRIHMHGRGLGSHRNLLTWVRRVRGGEGEVTDNVTNGRAISTGRLDENV